MKLHIESVRPVVRAGWAIRPVTRVKPSGKIYCRAKAKREKLR